MPDYHADGIGRCIICLCDDKPLTREHIVPYGLSSKGQMFIKQGTCPDCNGGMNERFENPAMQNDFLDARAVLALKRRKRKNQVPIRTHPVHALGADGHMHELHLKAEDHPGAVGWQTLQPAGLLVGEERDKDGTLTELAVWYAFLTPGRKKMPGMEFRTPHIAGATPMLMAKAGYAFAAAKLGIDTFDGKDIRDLLLWNRKDIYNFVGGLSAIEEFDTDSALHQFYLRQRGDLQTVVVHMFASFDAPPWEIVLGKFK